MIIAIDGPAGAGKSTAAKLVARRLGFLYIDTGAMYRALTLKAIELGVPINDENKLEAMAKGTAIKLINNRDGSLIVMMDGRDVSQQIRQPTITLYVSYIAKIRSIREIMVKLQRELGLSQDSVLDGRDIGTVVFPDAELKFYLDAEFNERVRRRYKELNEAGHKVTFADVESDLRNRDTIDSSREFAPLKKAQDAYYLDTTYMSIEEVVKYILDKVNRPIKNSQ